MRAKLRKATEAPKLAVSMQDNAEPRRDMPQTERLAPKRHNVLSDIEAPM
jgi:hypothetical protein